MGDKVMLSRDKAMVRVTKRRILNRFRVNVWV